MGKHLDELCSKLGIATSFSAQGIQGHQIKEDLLSFFCNQFGFDASDETAAAASLKKLDEKCFKEILKPIYICRENQISLDIYLKQKDAGEQIIVRAFSEPKKKDQDLTFEKTLAEEKKIGNTVYQKFLLNIVTNLEIGYYNLEIQIGKQLYHTKLAVAPQKCYTLSSLESSKLWGFTLQLYSLKSKHNWGVGDFTDLKNFAKIASGVGADVIGLNPINTLFHDFPENASPYSSISRLFLNPIYIDVEEAEGFNGDIKKKYAKDIEKLKKQDLIDYTGVYNLKIKVLYEIFDNLKKSSKAFEEFKKKEGLALNLFAIYQAIYHNKCHSVWGGWKAWPQGLKNQNPMDIAIFEETHKKEIEFFKFLQFEANRQFEKVANYINNLGLKIGLYRDLPVGVCKDGAELWCDRYAYIKDAGAGAPPDVFFQEGQKWCLGAFNPIELEKRAYEPFLKILRANMKYAGALRIDHVMSLLRLFMIKDDSTEGTYIYYNFDQMLSLVALESHLNKCLIVGESIGNVPAGFLEKLEENNIYSMSVLWAERWDFGAGDFKAPQYYPSNAFVCVGTHDMTPLKMWWFGYEIELKYNLKLIDKTERENLYKQREQDRWRLLKVLDENHTWPQDNLRKSDYLYGEGYPEGLDEAVHKFLGRSQSPVVVLQLEDILGVTELQNLPGTDRDKYPNWRHKLPINIEDLATDTTFIRNITAVKAGRG